MSPTAVEVQNVSKRFRLFQEKYTSLKERVIHAGKIPYQDLWALRDISLDVAEGETLGILGRNGSGKSTLLKCICGVLQPTQGKVVVKGSLAGLLELGAGFQQELSGRDNIYLNGTLLGLSRKQIDRRFDDIVAFAELEQFIDNQVKFYSSGMYIRLGFAVAVNMDPDVLVIDEVLAVGDERFQRKCIERVRQFQEEGRTIILVSHSPDQVRSICDRALVISDGHMVAIGQPGEAVRIFRDRLLEAGDSLAGAIGPLPEEVAQEGMAETGATAKGSEDDGGDGKTSAPRSERPVRISDVTVHYAGHEARPYLHPGEPLTVRVGYRATKSLRGVEFTIEFRDDRFGTLHKTDTGVLERSFDVEPGEGAVEFTVGGFPLLDGSYEVAVGIQSHLGGTAYDWRESAARFEVVNPGRQSGIVALQVDAAQAPSSAVAAAPAGNGVNAGADGLGAGDDGPLAQGPRTAEDLTAGVKDEEGAWSKR